MSVYYYTSFDLPSFSVVFMYIFKTKLFDIAYSERDHCA